MKPPTNHEQQQKEIASAAERTVILAAFRSTFTGEAGARVLAVLRASAGCTPGAERPTFVFTAAACDTHRAAWLDGRKSIVREIEAHLAQPEDSPATGPRAVR